MILKYFKLSFSIRLLWQSRVTSKSQMFAICFTSCPTAVDALTQLYLRQVARKAPMQSEKHSNRQNKKVARKTAATLYFISSFPCTISRNFCDESQLKLRCRISHSQRKSDNFSQRHCPFRYLCDFCRHISLYDNFACLTWLTVAYYLCFRHQSVNETFARIRLGTTNV